MLRHWAAERNRLVTSSWEMVSWEMVSAANQPQIPQTQSEGCKLRLSRMPILHLVRIQINYKCILILFHTSNANNRPSNTLAKDPSICYHTEECIHMMEENSKKTEKYKMNTKVYECSVRALHLYYKCIYMYIIRKQGENSNQISDVI